MLKKLAKKYLPVSVQNRLKHRHIKLRTIRESPGSWTSNNLTYRSPRSNHDDLFKRIEKLAVNTEKRGNLPLWEGYSEIKGYPTMTGQQAKRSSNQVRTAERIGEVFTWLVLQRKPSLIVEFGTAFGVSGMYWLAGLQLNESGELYTFEPNEIWSGIARENLTAISDRFTLTVGTFEDNYSLISDHESDIDLAFIDAIHTTEFVHSQLDLILQKAAPGALIVLDDILFSDDMKSCWKGISEDPRYAAAFEFNGVGVIELK